MQRQQQRQQAALAPGEVASQAGVLLPVAVLRRQLLALSESIPRYLPLKGLMLMAASWQEQVC